MTKTLTTLAVLALTLGALASTASAATPAGPYRTDNQAKRYLETQLPSWAGVNLHPAANPQDEFGYARTLPAISAYCSNGYYSKHEKRTRRHFRPASRVNRAGEDTFRSFSCSLSAYSDTDGDGQVTYDDDERTFHLYVQTRPGAWVVMVDR